MFDDRNSIDIDRLRDDMRDESLGAAFGGGFGAAFMEASDVDNASSDELVKMGQRQGIDLSDYRM